MSLRHVLLRELLDQSSVGQHDIYYHQLLVKGRGSPLWIPEPNMNLSAEYRRGGVRIGDVAILYRCEGYSFLFNTFHPADHHINVGRVHDGFQHIEFSKVQSAITKGVVFGPNDHLRSSSVQARKSEDSGYV